MQAGYLCAILTIDYTACRVYNAIRTANKATAARPQKEGRKRMTDKEKMIIRKSISICYKYGETHAAGCMEDAAEIYDINQAETSDGLMTEKELDTLSETINICDQNGFFGTGDAILSAIINHRINED